MLEEQAMPAKSKNSPSSGKQRCWTCWEHYELLAQWKADALTSIQINFQTETWKIFIQSLRVHIGLFERADLKFCDIFNVLKTIIYKAVDIAGSEQKRMVRYRQKATDRLLAPQSERQFTKWQIREQLKNGEIIAPEIKTWYVSWIQLRGKKIEPPLWWRSKRQRGFVALSLWNTFQLTWEGIEHWGLFLAIQRPGVVLSHLTESETCKKMVAQAEKIVCSDFLLIVGLNRNQRLKKNWISCWNGLNVGLILLFWEIAMSTKISQAAHCVIERWSVAENEN